MTFGFIYKIQFPNGKYYIGLTTTSLEQRRQEHKRSAKRGETQCLYKALRKYNMIDTFELIEIDTAVSLEELYEMEISYIIEYNSYYMNGKGYNMTFGGKLCTKGYIFTEEDKQKHSEGIKKYYENNYEARQKCSETTKKQFENPKARQQASETTKKYYETHPEARQQASETTKKQFENPEARQQASETTKKQFENPEARQQASETTKKYFQDTPNAGKEHGERMKRYYQDNPEAKEKMSEIKIKYYETHPESKEKMSEIKIKYYQENPLIRQKILDIKGKNNPFDIFSKDGTFIKTFTYQFEANEYLQKEHNITSTIKISEVLLGNRRSSAGFMFKYK